jgi:hypothetical protein
MHKLEHFGYHKAGYRQASFLYMTSFLCGKFYLLVFIGLRNFDIFYCDKYPGSKASMLATIKQNIFL